MSNLPSMVFNREGVPYHPLAVFYPDEKSILAVYQGKLSEFDVLLRYRQWLRSGKWSNIRTPKHIHWAVDVLTKMHQDKQLTQSFLDMLIQIWDETEPYKDANDRNIRLKDKRLLDEHIKVIDLYQNLSKLGEYSVEFLLLMAKLLMVQEKTNRFDAYMFRNLLIKLREGDDIFSIISTATHVGR